MLSKAHKKRLTIVFSGVLLISDAVMIFLAFSLAYWFRFHSALLPTPRGIPVYGNYFFVLIFIEVLLIAFMNMQGLYQLDQSFKFIDQIFSICKSATYTMLLVLSGTFFYRAVTYSRSLIFIIWLSLIVILVLSRYLLRCSYKKHLFPKLRKKVVVVCRPEVLPLLQEQMKPLKHFKSIIGYIATRHAEHQAHSDIQQLGVIDEFDKILDHSHPDEVVIADLTIPRKKVIRMILEAEKRMISFKIIADLLDIMIRKFELENFDSLTLIKIKGSPLENIYNRILKRFFDLLGSFLGILILSPVLLLVALLVKCSSKGPVFFVQERVSEGGKTFKMYKFRTMLHNNAVTGEAPQHTRKNDLRCTEIGKMLRKFNIDELPQLFNVLKGEMSLIGPRPEMPFFVDQLKDDIPRYMSRHHIKAGITGWAQVHGFRQGYYEERVKYDLYYIENWSFWLDVKIIILSFLAFKNAY